MLRTIIFEGPDRAGKSSTMKIFNQLTYFRYPTIDRYLMSYAVYHHTVRKYHEHCAITAMGTLKQMSNAIPVLIVYLTARLDVLNERAQHVHHEEIKNDQWNFFQQLYFQARTVNIPIIRIDTSVKSAMDVATDIAVELKEPVYVGS